MKSTHFCIITTTLHDIDLAKSIIAVLLEKNLAACVQMHLVESFYNWQGKMENTKEVLLQIKTRVTLFEKVKQEIKTLHDYEVPEIIMTPIIRGNSAYLKWIEDETKT